MTAGYMACGCALSFAQTELSIDRPGSFDNFRPADYDRLLGDALTAIEAGDFTAARQFISDALQIIKVNHGLVSIEQFHALQLLIEAALAQHDWQALDQHLAYFEWLLNKLAINHIESYLSGTEILNDLYLKIAADSDNPQNAHYLIAAKQLNWRTVTALELRYGKDSLQITPWLYNIVLVHYYQSTLTRRKGMTSYDYKSTTPAIVSGWSLSKNESLEQSYNIGQELLSRVRAIYGRSAKASPATDALMLLYMADWQMLFGRSSVAMEYYNLAYELVQHTNADAATLQAWFAQPVIIPQRDFRDSWQQQTLHTDTLINFTAWSPVFPGAQQPSNLAANSVRPVTRYSASARFDLTSMRGRTAATNAADSDRFIYAISNLSIEASTPANDLVTNQARHQIAELQFRPLLIDGVVAPASDIQLHFVFSAETDFSMLSDAN